MVNCLNPHEHVTDEGGVFVDINGDRRADLIHASSSDMNQPTYDDIFLNDGNNHWAKQAPWKAPYSLIRLLWSNPADPFCPIPTEVGPFACDGRCGVGKLCSCSTNPGSVCGLCREAFSGLPYGNCCTAWPNDCRQYQHPGFSDETATRLEDVNGDGLPDFIRKSDSVASSVLLNQGDGTFVADPNRVLPVSLSRPEGVRFADVNGDGLIDILHASGKNSAGNGVYINNGVSWVADPSYSIPVKFFDKNSNKDWSDTDAQLVDLNNDGIDDIITNDATYLGNGNGWTNIGYATPQKLTDSSLTYVLSHMIDINSDGLIDIVSNSDTDLGTGPYPNLLTQVTLPYGGTISYGYTASNRLKDSNGKAANPQLPILKYVLTSLATDDGLGLTASQRQTTITYGGGQWDGSQREFRGFAWAEETRADGSRQRTDFDQTAAKKGKPIAIELRDRDGKLLQRSELTYQDDSNGPPYETPLVAQVDRRFSWDTSGKQIESKTRSEMSYDTYGNNVRTVHWGDDTKSGDERTVFNKFYPNPAAWIVQAPAHANKLCSGVVASDPGDSGYLVNQRLLYDGNSSVEQMPLRVRLKKETTLGGDGRSLFTEAVQFDSYGNMTQVQNPLHFSTQYYFDAGAYHPSGQFVTRVVNPLGHTVRTQYDAFGRVEQLTDPNNVVTTSTYDPLHRLLKTAIAGEKAVTTKSYLSFGQPGEQRIHTEVKHDAALVLWQEDYLDGAGKTYKTIQRGSGEGKSIVNETERDSRGRPWKQYLPYFTQEGSGTYVETQYDALDRPIQIIKPDGSTVQYRYEGLKTIITNERGAKRTEERDAYGNLTAITEHTAKGDFITRYEYNPMNLLTRATDHGNKSDGSGAKNITTINWDNLGRKTAMSDPNLGNWSYTYDDAGNLETQTDGNGCAANMTYDALNRLTKKSFGATCSESLVYTREYDQVSGEDHGKSLGKQVRETGPTYTKKWYYRDVDNLGRLSTEELTFDGVTAYTKYTYNADGTVRATKLDAATGDKGDSADDPPSGEEVQVQYTYGEDGQLFGVKRWKTEGPLTLLSRIERNARGQPLVKEFGNGVVTSLSYDEAPSGDQRLRSLQTYIGGGGSQSCDPFPRPTPVQGSPQAGARYVTVRNPQPCGHSPSYLQWNEYRYDARGNVLSIASQTGSPDREFGYDELDRVILGGSSDNPLEYEYDPLGNLLKVKGTYRPFGLGATEDIYEK